MTILSDTQILQRIQEDNMISDAQYTKLPGDAGVTPIREVDGKKVISYGVSSYGYDARISNEFEVYKSDIDQVVDPKAFDISLCNFVVTDEPLVIAPNSFVLARTVEKFNIPRDIMAICVGKSTYARCGLIVNVTPLEPCLSSDTEVLTEGGWVNIREITKGDLILTRKWDTGEAVYNPVLRKQNYAYTGSMLHFDLRSVDQMVTPDHKLFVHQRNTRTNTYLPKYLGAQEVFNKYDYLFDREVNFQGSNPYGEYIEIGSSKFPLKTFLKFLGCYLGDGSSGHYSKKSGYIIKLACVTKEKKRAYFRAVLQSLGVKFYEGDSGFSFHSKDLQSYLSCLGTARNKYIPRDFLKLPKEYLSCLWEGLLNSDGTKSTNAYTTLSKKLADDVQELVYKLGDCCIIRKVQNQIKDGKPFDAYIVRRTSKTKTPKNNPKRNKYVPYSGFVYDVTVENHVFLIRRNGKVSWTGNCWNGYVTIEISNTSPLPARIYPNEGICQFIFLKASQVCQTSYEDKKGKYQDQVGVTPPKM